jgi:P27 family predicted phage terminase small subunit
MGRRGPAPRPTHLTLLLGNPGHRVLPVGEPEPAHKMPRRPALLVGEAKAEWDRQAPRLFAMKVLTEVDSAVMALYCVNWSRWVAAEAAVERSLDATGRLNRMRVLVAMKYATALLQAAGSLGLTPSARARIQLGQESEPYEPDSEGILS